jgi:hypothetical protein
MLILDILEHNQAVPEPRTPTDSHKVIIKVVIENAGILPAFIESAVAEVRPSARTTDGPLIFPIPTADELNGIGAVDGVESRTFLRPGHRTELSFYGFVDMSDELLKDYWGLGRRRLIFFGLVTYTDPLAVRRELGFTYIYQAVGSEAWMAMDDRPELNFDRITASRDADAETI